MNFDLHIQNIGKLTDAKIRIGRFTVFAGPNNTGKSFVSKILYSLFNAMNANHAEVHINNLIGSLIEGIDDLKWFADLEDADELLAPLYKEVDALRDMVVECPVGDFDELEKTIPNLARKVHETRRVYEDISSSIESAVSDMVSEEEPEARADFDGYLSNVSQSLNELEKHLNATNAVAFVTNGMVHKIKENLIQNFQVPTLSDLMGAKEKSSKIYIKSVCSFDFSDRNASFHIGRTLWKQLQQFSSVVYAESPTYWKLKNVLEDLRVRPRYARSRRERLSGVPGYFYDLASALRSQYTGEMAFQNVHDKLTGKEVLGGKIVISDTGAFLFQENGRSFTMPVTAMGVANLGVLALLIERKVLDQETFLFIDEPEAHLHPAWQVVMAETLFELAKGGAHVAIATHSADILKWLEVHIKKHPEDETLVALNKFPVNGCEVDDRDFECRVAAIKQELTRPFADLYVAGL